MSEKRRRSWWSNFFNSLMDNLTGHNLVDNASDSPFAENIQENTLKPTIGLFPLLLSALGVAATIFRLQVDLDTTFLLKVFDGDFSGLLSVVHLSIYSIILCLAWYIRYKESLTIFPHKFICRSIKRLAGFSIVISGACSISILFITGDMLVYSVELCLLALLLCFLSALILSYLITYLVNKYSKQLEDDKQTLTALIVQVNTIFDETPATEDLLNMREINKLAWGWFYFNLTSAILIGLYLSSISLFDVWSYTYVQEYLANKTNWASSQLLAADYLFILSLLLLGFVGGGLRTSIKKDDFSKEAYLFNLYHQLNMNNHNGEAASRSQEEQAETKGDNETESPSKEDEGEEKPKESTGNKLTVLAYSVLETTRLFDSLLGTAIIFAINGSILYSASALIFLLFSFSFNDLIDYKSGKDIDCHPSRPLPSGRLSYRTAKSISFLLLASGLGTAWMLSKDLFFVLLSCYVLSALYTILLKKYVPTVATPIWCMVVSLLALFPSSVDFAGYILFFAFFYSREVLLDFRDASHDAKHCKTPSIANYFKRTPLLITVLMISIACIASLLIGNNVLVLGTFSALFMSLLCWMRTQDTMHVANILKYHFILIVFI